MNQMAWSTPGMYARMVKRTLIIKSAARNLSVPPQCTTDCRCRTSTNQELMHNSLCSASIYQHRRASSIAGPLSFTDRNFERFRWGGKAKDVVAGQRHQQKIAITSNGTSAI